jgi:hypothetical protein
MDRAQDATLTNRGTRPSERATRVMACLQNTQAQVYLGRWKESSEPAALPLSPAGKAAQPWPRLGIHPAAQPHIYYNSENVPVSRTNSLFL